MAEKMDRTIHRVTRMIACNVSRDTILLTESDFANLASKLQGELEISDVFAFKSAVLRNIGSVSTAHLKEWERLFSTRLISEIESGELNTFYDFCDADAQECIEDYLEGCRFTYRLISYSVAPLHDKSDVVIRVTLRHQQTLMDRLLKRYGRAYDQILLLKSDIRRLFGKCDDFTLETNCCGYHFGAHGVRHVQ